VEAGDDRPVAVPGSYSREIARKLIGSDLWLRGPRRLAPAPKAAHSVGIELANLQRVRAQEVVWGAMFSPISGIGMTQELAELACGGRMVETGVELSADSQISPTYRCNAREFIVRPGKVAAYVR
jgi:hypothetical protein